MLQRIHKTVTFELMGQITDEHSAYKLQNGHNDTILSTVLEIKVVVKADVFLYTECKYGGPLGRPGTSRAKSRLVRPPAIFP